ncbi:hypothetical protein [uncultured Brachyspira sp.]|nr:hypothetical protein [uncultured Brachyspira sp.]
MNNNNQSKVVKDTDNMLEVLTFFNDTIETAEEHFVIYRSNIEIGGNDE